MTENSKTPGFDGCMAELRKANATLDRINGHFRGIRETLFSLPLFVIAAVGLSLMGVFAIKTLVL